MSSVSPPQTIPAKRRNGMLQSCEPCRRRKLSCDHKLPACGRCVRRGTSSVCYYHPAPLTKTPPGSSSLVSLVAGTTDPSPSPQSNAASTVPPPRIDQPVARQKDSALAFESKLPEILSVPSAGILMESATRVKHVGFVSRARYSSHGAMTETHSGAYGFCSPP
ncbi:hypothetical protein DOTSEDRAFT_131743 [Dothistroma septosporum NZE10]|uniref:Zn(2)-C6 fungal-type domain-containing protein n=1 Tax=Dothistroma septosporum (strain NZE10 / CBS 128990) TaxID=675120 RepID=M2YMM0_DOTSN|nr:hypothetical protein DOTSEDRAFT_131743 [Dothistroma septosporum NZE10]